MAFARPTKSLGAADVADGQRQPRGPQRTVRRGRRRSGGRRGADVALAGLGHGVGPVQGGLAGGGSIHPRQRPQVGAIGGRRLRVQAAAGERVGARGLLALVRSQRREEPAGLGRLRGGGVAFPLQVAAGLLRRVAHVEGTILHPQRLGLRDQRVGHVQIVFGHRLPGAAQQVGDLLVLVLGGVSRGGRLPYDCGAQRGLQRALDGSSHGYSRPKDGCECHPADKCVWCRFQPSSPCSRLIRFVPARPGRGGRHRRGPSSRSDPEIPVDESGLNTRQRPIGSRAIPGDFPDAEGVWSLPRGRRRDCLSSQEYPLNQNSAGRSASRQVMLQHNRRRVPQATVMLKHNLRALRRSASSPTAA